MYAIKYLKILTYLPSVFFHQYHFKRIFYFLIQRFTTEETLDFLARHTKVEEDESEALSEVNRKIFFKFSEYKTIWQKANNLTALTDGLLSLYLYSATLGQDESCVPEFRKPVDGKPYLKFVQGKHPIVVAANPDVAFIPNDFELDDNLAILTGANMGGKSTLMRYVHNP